MSVSIREFRDGDLDAVVALSVRAWDPVFVSIHDTLGAPLFRHFYGDDWRIHQAEAVRRACTAHKTTVAEVDGRVVGFTSIDLREGDDGEIYMLAVDPDAQGSGIGTQLTIDAIAQIRAAGKRVAVVGTGADPGHAAARATYRRAGFIPWPSEQLYLLLDEPM